MTIGECRKIAAEWVEANERPISGFIGAYIGGSTAEKTDSEEITGGSDMDVYVVLDGELPEKRGKIVADGALIEISYIALKDITPSDKVLRDYHLANSLRWQKIIADTDNALDSLLSDVAKGFFDIEYVKARRNQALDKVVNGLSNKNYSLPLPDLTLSWLFPTGIMTHAVLAAAKKNPTVRLRYMRAKSVLDEYGYPDVYEKLLELSGFGCISQGEAADMLKRLEPIYDRASVVDAPFFFASDISKQSRATAIDASYELIDKGFHRETIFWTITSYSRAMKMIAYESESEYERYLPDFISALNAIGRSDNESIRAAIEKTLRYIDELRLITDEIIALDRR